MKPKCDSRSEVAEPRKEQVEDASAFELRLAAMVVKAALERNGGGAQSARFWDDDLFDSFDSRREYVHPDLGHSEEETLPEMDEINWNIHECD